MNEGIVKKINIHQKGYNLQLEDVDDSDIEEYSKRMALLLKSKDVSILKVTSGCAIIRPSDTTAITITEEQVSKKKKAIEDVISDD